MSAAAVMPTAQDILAAAEARSAEVSARLSAAGAPMMSTQAQTWFEAGFIAGASYMQKQMREVA